MRDLLGWNISLGRWAGVHVRVHVIFVLFAVVALHFSASPSFGNGEAGDSLVWYGVASLLILFFSVLCHELGHCYMAWRLGGDVDAVLLWPLGGLGQVNSTHEPQDELATALAGPLVNLAVCLLLAPVLFMWSADDSAGLPGLANPLLPPATFDGLSVIEILRLTFWINWVLFLVNLLPAGTLDGGRVLRSFVWMRHGYRTAVIVLSRVAKLTALGLFVLALLLQGREGYYFTLLPLMLLGVFVFFSARHETDYLKRDDIDGMPIGEEWDSPEFAQHFLEHDSGPAGGSADPEPRASRFRQWLEERREVSRLRREELEREEDRQVDAILERLHKNGLGHLRPDERALLNRVSARYRSRLRG